MPFTLTSAQKTELESLHDSLNDPEVSYNTSDRSGYAQLYVKILSYMDAWDAISGNDLTLSEVQSKLWIEGALGVNTENSLQSDFIRKYNNAQKQLREGSGVSDAEMNRVSDEIAYDVADDIILNNSLPAIDTIANTDAEPAARVLFGEDNLGGWAGNPLFLFLGHDASFNNNIIGDGSDTYDLLAMSQIMYETFLDVGISNFGMSDYIGLVTGGFWGTDAGQLLFGAGYSTIASQSAPVISAAIDSINTMLDEHYEIGKTSLSEFIVTNDLILGSMEDDTLAADNGDDKLMHGGDGDDSLTGGDGDDILDGGLGDDTLVSSLGEDTLMGGEGMDVYQVHLDGNGLGTYKLQDNLVIDDIDGRFIVDFEDAVEEVFDESFYVAPWDQNLAYFSNLFPNSNGSHFQIKLNLNNNNAIFEYVPIDYDNPPPSGWMPTYEYQTFTITIMGLTSSNGVYNSNITIDPTDHTRLIFDFERDDAPPGESTAGDGGSNSFSGGAGNDTLWGNGGDDTLYGLAGNDAMYGGEGDDALNGGAGNDTVAGDAGRDTVWGDEGADLVTGGDANDTLYGGDGDDTVDGGTGADLVTADAGADYALGGLGDDQIYGNSGNDSLFGQDGNDTLQGEADDDYVDGGAGADGVYGGDGNDVLYGQAGNDWLDAGAGNDFLHGGMGTDGLTGGSGVDVFLFTDAAESTLWNGDWIYDFVSGTDKLDLSAIATGIALIGGSAFSGNTGQAEMRQYASGTNTVAHLDANGDTLVDLEIVLAGQITLAAGDLLYN